FGPQITSSPISMPPGPGATKQPLANPHSRPVTSRPCELLIFAKELTVVRLPRLRFGESSTSARGETCARHFSQAATDTSGAGSRNLRRTQPLPAAGTATCSPPSTRSGPEVHVDQCLAHLQRR